MSLALPLPESSSKPERKYFKNSAGEYACPDCPYTARNMSTMHYHYKKHSGVTNYVCKTCNKQFLQKQTLDNHIFTQHPTTPQTIPATIKFSDLKARKLAKPTNLALPPTQTPPPAIKVHTCPVADCDFSSISKGNCRIHCMRIHYGTYSNAQLERGADGGCICKLCSAEFKSLTHAYYHMASCLATTKLLPETDVAFLRAKVL